MIRVTIKGLQEAQRANLKMMTAIKPEGGLGRAVQYMTTEAHRYAIAQTHVDTGALKASHRINQLGAARYVISLDGSAQNPRSGARTSEYGPVEEARGGDHAFYRRTVFEGGPAMMQRAARYLVSQLP